VKHFSAARQDAVLLNLFDQRDAIEAVLAG